MKRILKSRAATLAVLVLLVGVLAKGYRTISEWGTPPHIQSLRIVASIGGQELQRDQPTWFSDLQPYIVALVDIGPASGVPGPLTVTWYREKAGGDEKLFEHRITVTCSDRAFSVGKNPGAFAPGIYRVVANLNDQTSELEFAIVATSQQSTPPGIASDAAIAGPPMSGSAGRLGVGAWPQTNQDPQRLAQPVKLTNGCNQIF